MYNLSDKVYDILKRLVTCVIPELGAGYLALAGIWGLPYGEQVSATAVVVTAILGAIIGFSSGTASEVK